jgi:hypothetical protein
MIHCEELRTDRCIWRVPHWSCNLQSAGVFLHKKLF